MKYLLPLIVAVAVYLHFYPNVKVTIFYNETKQSLSSMFSKYSGTRVGLKTEKIYQDLESELGSFSAMEIKRLKVITSSRDVVRVYYQDICQTKARDIILHIANQKKVCTVISHYASLL
jgi:xanthine dehydrogenase molybdopterin-binding subunit B